MTPEYQPTLAVHCVWHRDFAEGERYGKALFAHLFEDPADLGSHGLRIPVRVWQSPVADQSLRDAERSTVVVLVDDAALADQDWIADIEQIYENLRDGDAMLPVALSTLATGIPSSISELNFVRLDGLDPDLRIPKFLNRVTHTLCRLLSDKPDPVKVFLSHAKTDGVPITQKVRQFLQDGSGVQNFFDAQDIPEGARWMDVIHEAAAQRNVLLAVRTDGYASREWCRTEVLDAKLSGSAMVVLDALEAMEARGFPYLGNAPSVRWRDDHTKLSMEELLGVLLKQTLRFRYFPVRIDDICRRYGLEPPPHILPAPPELLTVLRTRSGSGKNKRLVYPDPPLGTEELALVSEFAPDLEPVTPTTMVAGQ